VSTGAWASLPWAPVARLTAHMTSKQVGEQTGTAPDTIRKYAERGAVPVHAGDRIACGLGLHPALIWDEWETT